LLYVEKESAAKVFPSLRLVETTFGTSLGVEIPVVRERELFTSELWLPDVPMTSSARTHLRVYGVESPSGAAVLRVRVYQGAGQDVVFDRTVSLGTDETPTPGDYDVDAPSFGFLDLNSGVAAPDVDGSVRVRVESLTPGLKFWAMASVTHNATQQVTIISPQ
jgi:hypothetical protein